MGQLAQQVFVGMQTSPAMQATIDVGHESPQAVEPPTVLQVWLGPQTLPQAPQLLLSVERFAQYGAPPPSPPVPPESSSGAASSPPPSPEPAPLSTDPPASEAVPAS